MNQFINGIQYFFPDGVKGTSRQLLDIVNDLLWEEAPAGSRPAGKWPASARQVSLIIREHTDDLRAAGWTVEQEGTRRPIRWHLVPPAKEEPRAEVVPRDVAEDIEGHLEEKLEEITQRLQESEQALFRTEAKKALEEVRKQGGTLSRQVEGTHKRIDHLVNSIAGEEGLHARLEAMDERISKLTEGVVALIAEAEAGAKARMELIEKLEEQQDEALRELERLSRPWWKIGGKK